MSIIVVGSSTLRTLVVAAWNWVEVPLRLPGLVTDYCASWWGAPYEPINATPLQWLASPIIYSGIVWFIVTRG
jgi:hypothetical protein